MAPDDWALTAEGFAEVCRAQRPLMVYDGWTHVAWAEQWDPARLADVLGHKLVEVVENPSSPLISQGVDLASQLTICRMQLERFLAELSPACGAARYAQVRLRFRDDDVLDGLVGPRGLPPMLGRAVGRAHSAVWLTTRDVRTPTHVDLWDGVLLQVSGRKVVHLFPPTSPSGVGKLARRLRAPAASCEELIRDVCHELGVTWHRFVLEPGAMLYIPAGWAHDVESLTPAIAVSLRFTDPDVAGDIDERKRRILDIAAGVDGAF